jgi:hypothetical protein
MDSTARQAAPSTRYYSRSMQRARVRPWVIASSHQTRVAPALATTVVRLLSIRFRFRARDPDVEDERSTNHSNLYAVDVVSAVDGLSTERGRRL